MNNELQRPTSVDELASTHEGTDWLSERGTLFAIRARRLTALVAQETASRLAQLQRRPYARLTRICKPPCPSSYFDTLLLLTVPSTSALHELLRPCQQDETPSTARTKIFAGAVALRRLSCRGMRGIGATTLKYAASHRGGVLKFALL